MKGKLIVIDGSDASGKHTQAELLNKKLIDSGYKVRMLDFPQYNSFFGQMIKAYLNGEYGDVNDLDPKIPSLFYALDRQAQRDQLVEWLNEGCIVILDRYIESNMAYQGAKFDNPNARAKFISWLEELEYENFKLPKADVVLFLHVATDITKTLMESRPDKSYIKDAKKDIHEKNDEYLKKVESTYFYLAEKCGWSIVECVDNDKLLSREEVSEKVYNVIKEKIS